MRLIRWMICLVAVLTLIAASGGVARADTIFAGNTGPSTPTTVDDWMTFTSSTFHVNLPDGAGPFELSDLGYFTLNGCGEKNCTEDFGSQDSVTDFVLKIHFTSPDVFGNPAVFDADVFGSVTRAGNSSDNLHGSVTMDFDNTPQHLSFTNGPYSGTFDLSVNDPAIFSSSAQFGDTRVITGQITNLVDPLTAPVPEPSSLGLLGTLLAGGAFPARRRFRA